jgi:hypothetical protein
MPESLVREWPWLVDWPRTQVDLPRKVFILCDYALATKLAREVIRQQFGSVRGGFNVRERCTTMYYPLVV